MGLGFFEFICHEENRVEQYSGEKNVVKFV